MDPPRILALPRPHRAVVAWLLLAAPTLAAGQTELSIKALDPGGKVLAGIRFSFNGVESLPTTDAGVTGLVVPELAGGEAVKLDLPRSLSEEWFLVDSTVHAPAGPKEGPAEVVLMRRAEFRALAGNARDAAGQASRAGEEISEDQKRRVLVEYASQHGLSEPQLAAAIASFGATEDPMDRGIAAYLEGQYAAAETALLEVAEEQESDFVETLRYLGAAQYAQAKYRDAITTFRRAVAVRPEDAVLLSWLGISLDEMAEWDEAEPLMRRALAIDEASLGPEHPSVAIRLNNLAQLLKATNRLAEAEPLMRRALAIDEASFGAEHPNVAIDLNNLALLLKATYRLAEAEPLMRRALAIDEASFGPEHPKVAIRLNNLAQLLQDTNRLAEAEPLMRRALAIFEASLGEGHPNTRIVRGNLTLLLSEIADPAAAPPPD